MPTPPDALHRIAADVRALLAFQGELGLRGLDVPPGVLGRWPARAGADRAPQPTADRRDDAGARGAEPDAARRDAIARVAGLSSETAPMRRPARSGAAAPVPLAERSLPPPLRAVRDDIGDCTRCKLHKGRTHVVFGVGNPKARLMFIGEGPGRDEDLQGEPFVGAAGQLLDRMVKAMGLARADVYIANIVKCRPPGNRDPEPDEIAACERFLKAQIAAIRPEVLVALGRVAAQTLLKEQTPVSRLRGAWRTYEGLPLMPTFHPAYLLRTPGDKKLVWEDMQDVMKRLGLPAPSRGA
jgi:DNA polymerase